MCDPRYLFAARSFFCLSPIAAKTPIRKNARGPDKRLLRCGDRLNVHLSLSSVAERARIIPLGDDATSTGEAPTIRPGRFLVRVFSIRAEARGHRSHSR